MNAMVLDKVAFLMGLRTVREVEKEFQKILGHRVDDSFDFQSGNRHADRFVDFKEECLKMLEK